MAISKNSNVTIPAIFSITGERTEAIVKEINTHDLTCEVQYPNGYIETLPLSVLEGL